jgi:hypothetical protein
MDDKLLKKVRKLLALDRMKEGSSKDIMRELMSLEDKILKLEKKMPASEHKNFSGIKDQIDRLTENYKIELKKFEDLMKKN